MNKLFSVALLTTLITTNAAHAHECETKDRSIIGTTIEGTWQLVKIGVGGALAVGGVTIAAPPIAVGIFGTTVDDCLKEKGHKKCGECIDSCGKCCFFCGIVSSLPLFYASYRSIKGGFRGLKKLFYGTPCKKCIRIKEKLAQKETAAA